MLFLIKNNLLLYIAKKNAYFPYMGVVIFKPLEQVSEFSTIQIGYPQYLVSYPQY